MTAIRTPGTPQTFESSIMYPFPRSRSPVSKTYRFYESLASTRLTSAAGAASQAMRKDIRISDGVG